MRSDSWMPLAVVAGLATLCCCGSRSEIEQVAAADVGRSALVLAAEGGPVIEPLLRMGWKDIVPTARAAWASGVAQTIMLSTGELESGPAGYLVGLLHLSDDSPLLALQKWDSLDRSGMPADFLYAPWRLSNQLRPGEQNAYRELLGEAVVKKTASALIRARYLATGSRWDESLENYLQTDPGLWAGYDLESFRRLLWQSPAAGETRVFRRMRAVS